MARILLRYGASLDARDVHGEQPLAVAVRWGHHDVADAIHKEDLRRRAAAAAAGTGTAANVKAKPCPRGEEQQQHEQRGAADDKAGVVTKRRATVILSTMTVREM